MSRRLGQSGDATATNGKTIALGLTVAMVAVVALSIPVGYVMAGSGGATGTQGQAGDGGLQTGTQGNYSVHQGENCTEVVPVANDDSVKAFYDYRTPFATNEYTNQTGESYSSEGTTALQEPNTSVLFLHEGPAGNLSLVGVHGALDETSTSGAVSFDVAGLPANGTWAVKDDEYDHASSIDNWTHDDGNASIDWAWAGARTDGFAFEGLGEDFDVTVEPAFNENATLFGEQYDGTVENWTLVSNVSSAPEDSTGVGATTTYNRTVLNTSQNVSVVAGTCEALSSAAPTPTDDGAGDTTGDGTDGPVGGGAETPDEGDADEDPSQDDIETEEPDEGDDGDDVEDTNGDDETDGDGDDDTQELDSIDLEIDWDTIGPGESVPVTVTADYGDSSEDVTDEAALSSSDESIATIAGTEVEGVSPGDVEITATFDDQSDTESLSVESTEDPSQLEGLELQVGTTQLAPGETTNLSVQADTSMGEQDVTGDADITSGNSDAVSVEGSTLVANGEGEATITADYLDRSDSVEITVAGDDDGDDGDEGEETEEEETEEEETEEEETEEEETEEEETEEEETEEEETEEEETEEEETEEEETEEEEIEEEDGDSDGGDGEGDGVGGIVDDFFTLGG